MYPQPEPAIPVGRPIPPPGAYPPMGPPMDYPVPGGPAPPPMQMQFSGEYPTVPPMGSHVPQPPHVPPMHAEPGGYHVGFRSASSISSETQIPEDVVDYLIIFKRAVANADVPKIRQLYEVGFPELTERHYRERFWPPEELVKKVVGDDSDGGIFISLYKELYYRYVYGRIQRGPSLEHRYSSYENYNHLFDYLVSRNEPTNLNLPNRWLWDIIDEFVYQFQSFCQYKCNPGKRNPDELEELAQVERDVWNLYPVINILNIVVQKSQVKEALQAIKYGPILDDDDFDDFGRSPFYFGLGYFSLIGLLRVHVLLGDYKQALRTVDNIDFVPSELYNTVPSCYVAFHYYVGFAKMMMRHYQEAIKIFVNCLLFIQRTRNTNQQQQQTKSWQYDVVSKTNDQIYQLLSICLVLAPQRIDESVHSQLQEKLSERMNRMRRGEISEFENAFQIGCPKFLAPTVTAMEARENLSKEPIQLQTKVFVAEIKEQIQIPILRGYLRLYSSIPMSKLAAFMDVSEDELMNYLFCFKHKMFDLGRDSALDGADDDTTTDLDFYIDKDMIHIADTKLGRRYGEYFIRHIQKLMELNRNLQKLDLKGVNKAAMASSQPQQSDRRKGGRKNYD